MKGVKPLPGTLGREDYEGCMIIQQTLSTHKTGGSLSIHVSMVLQEKVDHVLVSRVSGMVQRGPSFPIPGF